MPPTKSIRLSVRTSLIPRIGSSRRSCKTLTSSDATSRYQAAASAYQQTASQLIATYQKIGKLQPNEPGVQLQLAQTAESIGDYAAAIAAYKRFIRIAPDDASVPQAQARIKTLQRQLAGSSSSAQG